MSRGNSGQIGPYRQPTSGILTPAALQQAVVEALVVLVAGGASGAGNGGAGGGSGGFRDENLQLSRGVVYPIKIGLGGVGIVDAAGNNGQDSVLAGLTAIGGGKQGTNGGSGGGAPYATSSPGAGTQSQGSAGSISGGNGSGGGGSAAETPAAPAINFGGIGGQATATLITGTAIKLAAGGGGVGNWPAGGPGLGGSNIGGNANYAGTGGNGAANTGSGGGGGAPGYAGGNGGSGVAYIRVPDIFSITFSAGVTATMSTAVPGYKVYTITATATGSETFVVF